MPDLCAYLNVKKYVWAGEAVKHDYIYINLFAVNCVCVEGHKPSG